MEKSRWGEFFLVLMDWIKLVTGHTRVTLLCMSQRSEGREITSFRN